MQLGQDAPLRAFPARQGIGRGYLGLVAAVRILMGTDFLVNGLNWWVKLIDAYPSLADYVHHAPPADFVGAMIQTGVMFHIVKATELLTGVALLANRFVPLMLVVVFPITVPVFVVDVVLVHHLRGFIMGCGSLLMNVFLILCYLNCYRPMLRSVARPDGLARFGREPPRVGVSVDSELGGAAARVYRRVMPVFGVVAGLFGGVMVGWVATMIVQRLARG